LKKTTKALADRRPRPHLSPPLDADEWARLGVTGACRVAVSEGEQASAVLLRRAYARRERGSVRLCSAREGQRRGLAAPACDLGLGGLGQEGNGAGLLGRKRRAAALLRTAHVRPGRKTGHGCCCLRWASRSHRHDQHRGKEMRQAVARLLLRLGPGQG